MPTLTAKGKASKLHKTELRLRTRTVRERNTQTIGRMRHEQEREVSRRQCPHCGSLINVHEDHDC